MTLPSQYIFKLGINEVLQCTVLHMNTRGQQAKQILLVRLETSLLGKLVDNTLLSSTVLHFTKKHLVKLMGAHMCLVIQTNHC